MEEIRFDYKTNLYEGFVDVTEYGFSYPKKNTSVRRIVISRPEAIAILIYNKTSGKVVIIRQFRAPVFAREGDGYVYEVPAGVMEPNEGIHQTLIRETIEETGYKIEKPELLCTFYPTVGILDERIHLFWGVVEDKDKVGPGGGLDSEKEYIDILELAPKEVFKLLDDGLIVDGKTIIALFYLRKLIDEGKLGV